MVLFQDWLWIIYVCMYIATPLNSSEWESFMEYWIWFENDFFLAFLLRAFMWMCIWHEMHKTHSLSIYQPLSIIIPLLAMRPLLLMLRDSFMTNLDYVWGVGGFLRFFLKKIAIFLHYKKTMICRKSTPKSQPLLKFSIKEWFLLRIAAEWKEFCVATFSGQKTFCGK